MFDVGIGTAQKFPKMMKALKKTIGHMQLIINYLQLKGREIMTIQVGRRVSKEMAEWLEEADTKWQEYKMILQPYSTRYSKQISS